MAVGAGVLVALSLPPWGWWPLSFVGVAMFDAAVDGLGRRRRVGLATLFGLGWLALGMMWMWQLTVPGYIAASLIFAAWHGLAELVVPQGRGSLIGRPAAHALVEAWRMSFPFGGVPLATLGIAQVGGPFAGLARVGGVILLTWFVLQVAVAARRLIARARHHAGLDAPAAALVAAGLVMVLVALVAPRGHGTGEFLDVVAVQGGGEQGTRALDVPSRVVTERHVEATATIEPDPAIDVVVWPENVVDTDDFAASEQLVAITDQAARLGVPIAVGVTEDVPGEPGRVTNAQIVVTPDGEQFSRYDKVRRVPFGEYVPMRGALEALGAPVDQVPTNAVAGTTPAVVDLPDGTRFGVVISWEVFFGGRAREGVKHGATVLMNPTNGASYTGTIVQTQQVASSRLRAIETGRWLVQAAPTGFSEFVTPAGEVISRTGVGEQAVIRHEVELRTGRTWYVTLGDGPWIVLLLSTLAAAWWWSRRATATDRRRATRPSADLIGGGLWGLVALVVALTRIGDQPLSSDEAFTALLVTRPFTAVVRALGTEAGGGPQHVLLAVWSQLGDDATWLRLTSAIVSAIGVAATYGLARRFAGPAVSSLAAAVVLVQPTFLRYVVEIRASAWLVALGAVTTLLTLRLADRPTLGRAAGLGLAAGLFVANSVFAIFVVGVQLAWLAGRRCGTRVILTAAAIGVAVLAPFVPAYVRSDQLDWIKPTTWRRIVLNAGQFLGSPLWAVVLGLGGLAFVWTFRGPIADRWSPERLLAASVIALPVGLTAVSWLVQPVYVARYLTPVLPLVVVMAVVGWAALVGTGPARPWVLGAAAATVAAVAVVGNISRDRPHAADLLGPADTLTAGVQPGDVVVFDPGFLGSTIAYYWQPPTGVEIADRVADAPDACRVWEVVATDTRPDGAGFTWQFHGSAVELDERC